MNKIDKNDLLRDISTAYPYRDMPLYEDLSFHKSDCQACEYLRRDIEEYRVSGKIDDLINSVHRDITLLSPITLLWLLPYYLKYCLSPEGEYTRMETEFLVYALKPSPEIQYDALEILSLLDDAQIDCLFKFLVWVSEQQDWQDFFGDDIQAAIKFLRSRK